jgi:hypothetical protein
MLHLKECEFRFNHRKENLYNIVKKLLKNTRDACLEPKTLALQLCFPIKDYEPVQRERERERASERNSEAETLGNYLCLPLKLCFYDNLYNFGDMLNVSILKQIFNMPVEKSSPRHCEAVCIGSILQSFISRKWRFRNLISKYLRCAVKVWGTGFIQPEPNASLRLIRKMDVCAVRGKLSLERMRQYTGNDLKETVIGDPGLLAGRLIDISKIKQKYTLGIVPHYVDKNNPLLKKVDVNHSVVIDTQQSPEKFMQEIARCKTVISSAMHGLIAADSLGIPNIRMILSDMIVGGDYKFNEYYSVFGIENHNRIDLNKIDKIDKVEFIQEQYKIRPEQVADICENLVRAFPYKKGKNNENT